MNLPTDVIDRVLEIARGAERRGERDDALADIEEHLAPHGFVPRIREDEGEPVLVCYPAEWVEDGVIRFERVEEVGQAVERPLFPSRETSWEAIASGNREVVARVRERHGRIHAENARAFADFMDNHCRRTIADATDADIAEFLDEYYPRNAWPSDDARREVERSIALARGIAEETL